MQNFILDFSLYSLYIKSVFPLLIFGKLLHFVYAFRRCMEIYVIYDENVNSIIIRKYRQD